MNTTDIKHLLIKPARLVAVGIWLFAGCKESVAQEPTMGQTIDSMLLQYPFIKQDANVLGNDSLNLDAFFQKLADLKAGKRDRVTIVQIGDSHIQADFLTGQVRQEMQLQFGNAGRGIVFPYRALKTNGPPDYHTQSAGPWTSKRNIFPDQAGDIGLCGITLETLDTNAYINVRVDDLPGLDYGFNKLTVINDGDANSFVLGVCDEYNCVAGSPQPADPKYPFARVQTFDSPMHNIVLNFAAQDSLAKYAHVYGLYLENGKPGVIYNMIGVNGAMYRNYNLSGKFLQQLAYLKPDLVIVSMGTNEAFRPGFKPEEFRRQMDTLVSGIRRNCAGTGILLTTPGDSFRRTRKGRVKNPDMQTCRNTVIAFAKENHAAYWDLYDVMGGYGSMAKWYVSGMAAYDRLHFSRKGYEIQGELLYRAMMKGYDRYVLRKAGK